MAVADNSLAERKIAKVKACLQNADIHRFLHGLPIFQVEPDLPDPLKEGLARLEKAERKAAAARGAGGSGKP